MFTSIGREEGTGIYYEYERQQKGYSPLYTFGG